MNIFQRLAHKWFGWEYVAHKFGYDWDVKRLHRSADGTPYVVRFGGNLHFIHDAPNEFRPITFTLEGKSNDS